MLRFALAIAFSVVLVGTISAREEIWGVVHPEAKARLLKVFENHPGFREAFTEWTSNHHPVFKELVAYLAEDDRHNVEEFVRKRERKDKETPILEHLHEKHREGLAEFRVFVKEHKEAALALTQHEREIEHLDRVAEKNGR